MDDFDNVAFQVAPDDKVPKCPYCKQELGTIWIKTSGMGFKGEQDLLMCPHCESFLGLNAWKR